LRFVCFLLFYFSEFSMMTWCSAHQEFLIVIRRFYYPLHWGGGLSMHLFLFPDRSFSSTALGEVKLGEPNAV